MLFASSCIILLESLMSQQSPSTSKCVLWCFWKKWSRSTSYFLTHQNILILTLFEAYLVFIKNIFKHRNMSRSYWMWTVFIVQHVPSHKTKLIIQFLNFSEFYFALEGPPFLKNGPWHWPRPNWPKWLKIWLTQNSQSQVCRDPTKRF